MYSTSGRRTSFGDTGVKRENLGGKTGRGATRIGYPRREIHDNLLPVLESEGISCRVASAD